MKIDKLTPELLGKVLERDIKSIKQDSQFESFLVLNKQETINIFELMFKMKEYAYKKGYMISIFKDGVHPTHCGYRYVINISWNEVYEVDFDYASIEFDTEFEAVLEALIWVDKVNHTEGANMSRFKVTMTQYRINHIEHKFKSGDWVLDDEDTLLQVKKVKADKIALTDEPYYVPAKNFRLAIKAGDWCWFNMKIDYEWQSPVLMRYGEQDMSMWSIEPFIGNLPNFIKSKALEQIMTREEEIISNQSDSILALSAEIEKLHKEIDDFEKELDKVKREYYTIGSNDCHNTMKESFSIKSITNGYNCDTCANNHLGYDSYTCVNCQEFYFKNWKKQDD